jgi:type 1 glutamine amidotransferase
MMTKGQWDSMVLAQKGAFFMLRLRSILLLAFLATGAVLQSASAADQPLKVLIIGGQNNHNWAKSTPYMEQVLNRAGHIRATVQNTPGKDATPADWDAWQPKFRDFACVVLDYNGPMWPERVQQDFLAYVREGGGVVVIHAANNSFSGWKEYEQMVGLLWRGRDYGASLYLDDEGKLVREEPGQGRGMGHGGQYDWAMTVRDADHPITRGMPVKWMHKHDELYHGQRGPAENVHLLLTAFSDPAAGRGGTGKNEPIVWWIPYGQGKVVTNLMGHVGELGCMECVGFQVLLYRSCEWAATGNCTTPMPTNFPTADATSLAP